jgi:hypothetical protein
LLLTGDSDGCLDLFFRALTSTVAISSLNIMYSRSNSFSNTISLRTTFKWCSIDQSYSPRPPPPSSEPSPAAALFPSFIAHGGAVRVDGTHRTVVARGRTVRGRRASIVRTNLGRRRPRPPRTLPAEASPSPPSCARQELFALARRRRAFVRAWAGE